MAVSIQSQLAANLEDLVTCSICTDRLQAPKHLQCQHSFCTHCLEELMASPANLNSNSLPCPTCRHLTDLPPKGVDRLPADFNKNILMDLLSFPTEVAPAVANHQQCSTCRLTGSAEISVSYCNDCEEYLCVTCLDNHNSEPALHDHVIILGLQDDLSVKGYLCNVHNGKKLAFYCPQCLCLICGICLRTTHLKHGALTIEEATEQKKKVLSDVLLLIEQTRKSIERACPLKECHQVDAMFDSLQQDVHEHAKTAKLSIDKWLQQVCEDLSQRRTITHAKIQKRKDYMTILLSLQAYYEEWVADSDSRGLLTGFDELLGRAGPLINQDAVNFTTQRWSFVPVTWPVHLGYLEEEDATIFSCANRPISNPVKRPILDVVQDTLSNTSPGSCCRGQEIIAASCSDSESDGEEVTTEIIAASCSDSDGEEVTTEMKQRCQSDDLQTGPGESQFAATVQDMVDLPPQEDPTENVEFFYLANGNAIVNGKLKSRTVRTWTNTRVEDDIVTRSSDVILGTADWLLLTDPARGRVQRLWFDDPGMGPETVLQNATPRRMALSADGSIAITDQGYVHMLAVKADAITIRPKWTPLEMVKPFGVGFTVTEQRLVLTDMHARTVVIYDENLRHLISFGGPETFGSPNCLSCDQKGRILVSDQTKNNVQAFSLAGQFLWKIDHFAPHEPLVAPSAISVDGNGLIYVGCVDGLIGVYNTDGRFICHLVDRYDTITNVRGISCRTDACQTLVAVGGATGNDHSMVRLWQLTD